MRRGFQDSAEIALHRFGPTSAHTFPFFSAAEVSLLPTISLEDVGTYSNKMIGKERIQAVGQLRHLLPTTAQQ